MPTAVSPVQELQAAVNADRMIRFIAEFDLPGDRTMKFTASGNLFSVREGQGTDLKSKKDPKGKDLAGALTDLAARYPRAEVRIEKLYVETKTVSKAELKKLFTRAWAEVRGQPIPTDKDLSARRKAAKAVKTSAVEDVVALLRSGPKGIAAFNARPDRERRPDLRKADLSGSDLSGLKLDFARLEGANLSGATIRDVDVRWGSARGADFSRADLAGTDLSILPLTDAKFVGANLRGTLLNDLTLLRADFTGADLTGAEIVGSDVRGATFTGAVLKDANLADSRFDEKTKWPKGFTPPPDMKWKGKGADPRFAPTKREKKLPPPADFGGFLTRLQKATDPAKLQKAMAMLKAERFRLFAKVAEDHLVGVVKSQSDPDLVYACRLARDGVYSCCTQNLHICGGLRGSPCKHLLVLIVGLTKAGELDPATAHTWAQASRGQKPVLDKEATTETLLQYKGAEAGEVDWRPTETIPEDFYAM